MDTNERVADGVKTLVARFQATTSRREHLLIVDEELVRRQFSWLRRNRWDLWKHTVRPAIRDSWVRTRGDRAR